MNIVDANGTRKLQPQTNWNWKQHATSTQGKFLDCSQLSHPTKLWAQHRLIPDRLSRLADGNFMRVCVVLSGALVPMCIVTILPHHLCMCITFTSCLSHTIVTSPAGALAQYCGEYVSVCVSVCLSVRPRGYFRNHTLDLYQFLCMLPMAMAWSSSGRVTKCQGEGAVMGVWFPTDDALYSIAFGTRTKTAESIEKPFGVMRGLDPRNNVLRGGYDPRREMGNLEKNMCQTSLTPFANWTGPCSGVHKIGTDAWLQALDESIIGREGDIAHRGRSLISTTALLQLRSVRFLINGYVMLYYVIYKSGAASTFNDEKQTR